MPIAIVQEYSAFVRAVVVVVGGCCKLSGIGSDSATVTMSQISRELFVNINSVGRFECLSNVRYYQQFNFIESNAVRGDSAIVLSHIARRAPVYHQKYSSGLRENEKIQLYLSDNDHDRRHIDRLLCTIFRYFRFLRRTQPILLVTFVGDTWSTVQVICSVALAVGYFFSPHYFLLSLSLCLSPYISLASRWMLLSCITAMPRYHWDRKKFMY